MSKRRRGRYYGGMQVASSSEAPFGGVAHFNESNKSQMISMNDNHHSQNHSSSVDDDDDGDSSLEI